MEMGGLATVATPPVVYCARHGRPSLQNVAQVAGVVVIEVVLGTATTSQTLTIGHLLQIVEAHGHAVVATRAEGVEVDGEAAVATAVNLILIQNGVAGQIDNAGAPVGVGIEEVATLEGLVIGPLLVTVPQGQLQVGRPLTLPLGLDRKSVV